MAVENLITDHLDSWTAAIKTKSAAGRGSSKKLELVGIKKLRELILDLAVRGKLVPQDPNDVPASELLKLIEAEKAQLVKVGKIKKQKSLPQIAENEKPFELKNGWALEHLGDLSHYITKGTTPTSVGFAFQDSGVNFIKIENVSKGRINLSINQYISEEADEALKRSRLLVGDVLFSIAGTIGKTCVVVKDDLPANTNQALAIIRGTTTVFNENFLMIQLDSFVAKKTRDRARGGAMPNVSLADLNELVAIIPPLEEQHRIVAKVDELMVLCDQLEAQTESSIDAHKTLVEVLLATLTDAKDADELNDNWQTISQHFDVLFTTQASIDQLKQTILQLAVMGKLVKQDPKDEPASKQLERIATEKQQLIKDGKIKKQKTLPEITDEEKPFELPVGWVWCRFYELFCNLKYGTSKKSEYKGIGTPILRIPNVVKGFIDSEDLKFTPLTAVEVNDLSLKKDDILIIRSNGSTSIVGSSAVVDDSHVGFAYAGYLVRVRLPKNFNNSKFIHLVLKSVLIRSQIENPLRTTSGVKNINSTEISRLILPIIPLKEQNRIVVKVNELMALCDSFKERLNQAQTTQLHLTDAIVEQAL
jgi:type I restriction enzyme S subunit